MKPNCILITERGALLSVDSKARVCTACQDSDGNKCAVGIETNARLRSKQINEDAQKMKRIEVIQLAESEINEKTRKLQRIEVIRLAEADIKNLS